MCEKNSSINERFKIFVKAFRARKFFGTFEKQAPGLMSKDFLGFIFRVGLLLDGIFRFKMGWLENKNSLKWLVTLRYRKIPIIISGPLLVGLFSGRLTLGGAYYQKEFCASKWVRLDNKNSVKDSSLKQLNLTPDELTFGGAYYRKDISI